MPAHDLHAKTLGPAFEDVRDLFERTSGDEKHDPSSRSTLDVLWVLYDRVLRHDPGDPSWPDRDRFLLSKGHGPLALYTVLASWGYFSTTELNTFMAFGSRLGAHPDRRLVPGVEVSTGSLGHGVPMAVGVALALRAKRSDRHVFVLLGDAEANEGSVWESFLLAGSQHLGNLTAIWIDNHSSTPDLGDLPAKLEVFGWAPTRTSAADHDGLEAGLRAHDDARPSALIVDWRRP
jgi:transketolase